MYKRPGRHFLLEAYEIVTAEILHMVEANFMEFEFPSLERLCIAEAENEILI